MVHQWYCPRFGDRARQSMRLGAVCPGDERCLPCFMRIASIFPVIALLIYLFFRSKITRKKLLKKKKEFLCHTVCFSTLWLWRRSWPEKYDQNKTYPPVHIWIWSVCHDVDSCLGVFPLFRVEIYPVLGLQGHGRGAWWSSLNGLGQIDIRPLN